MDVKVSSSLWAQARQRVPELPGLCNLHRQLGTTTSEMEIPGSRSLVVKLLRIRMDNPPAQTESQSFLARATRRADVTTNAGETQASEAETVRRRCWDGALHTYATSYIFQYRAQKLGVKLNWITYVGFVVPMIVGLLVLSQCHLEVRDRSLTFLSGSRPGAAYLCHGL